MKRVLNGNGSSTCCSAEVKIVSSIDPEEEQPSATSCM